MNRSAATDNISALEGDWLSAWAPVKGTRLGDTVVLIRPLAPLANAPAGGTGEGEEEQGAGFECLECSEGNAASAIITIM